MLISFILDETGSMSTAKQQTISGFNEYVNTLRKEKNAGKMKFTLTKFNSKKVEIVQSGVKIADAIQLSDDNYHPVALTPLYDAIGKTIKSIGNKKKVLVVIQTDGCENNSKEYTREAIFDLIAEKKKKGWAFIFLGADQDAWQAAQVLGIPRSNTASYDSAKTVEVFYAVTNAAVAYTRSDGKQTTDLFSHEPTN